MKRIRTLSIFVSDILKIFTNPDCKLFWSLNGRMSKFFKNNFFTVNKGISGKLMPVLKMGDGNDEISFHFL